MFYTYNYMYKTQFPKNHHHLSNWILITMKFVLILCVCCSWSLDKLNLICCWSWTHQMNCKLLYTDQPINVFWRTFSCAKFKWNNKKHRWQLECILVLYQCIHVSFPMENRNALIAEGIAPESTRLLNIDICRYVFYCKSAPNLLNLVLNS